MLTNETLDYSTNDCQATTMAGVWGMFNLEIITVCANMQHYVQCNICNGTRTSVLFSSNINYAVFQGGTQPL